MKKEQNTPKKSILDHPNFKYLENLNCEMEDWCPFLIDRAIDFKEYEKLFIQAEFAMCDILNVGWLSLTRILSGNNIEVFLYKGELYLYKEDVQKMTGYLNKYSCSEEREQVLNNTPVEKTFIQHPKDFNVIAHQYFRTRSYFMNVETTLSTLGINYSELNTLVNDGILQVIVRRIQVYFYSYQVEEILHILGVGEDHWLGC